MARPRNALLSPRVDAWVLGGSAVAFWVAVEALRGLGGPPLPSVNQTLNWVFTSLVAAHFGLSYHLAYSDRTAGPRRHPLALIWIPAAAVSAILTAWYLIPGRDTAAVIRALVTLVFALTTWHYIKQAYGVARLSAGLAGFKVDRALDAALRYGLYPVWGLSLTRLFTADNGYLLGYRVGGDLLPGWTDTVASIASGGGVVVLAVVLVRAGVRSRRVVPASVWTPAAAGFAWLAFAPNYTSTAIVLAATHALQYLACGYRAEATWAEERAQPQPRLWLLCVFLASGVGGLFATMWLAPGAAMVTGRRMTDGAVAVSLFVILNLHHYAIDASIWKRGGSHLRRLSAGPSAPELDPGRLLGVGRE